MLIGCKVWVINVRNYLSIHLICRISVKVSHKLHWTTPSAFNSPILKFLKVSTISSNHSAWPNILNHIWLTQPHKFLSDASKQSFVNNFMFFRQKKIRKRQLFNVFKSNMTFKKENLVNNLVIKKNVQIFLLPYHLFVIY